GALASRRADRLPRAGLGSARRPAWFVANERRGLAPLVREPRRHRGIAPRAEELGPDPLRRLRERLVSEERRVWAVVRGDVRRRALPRAGDPRVNRLVEELRADVVLARLLAAAKLLQPLLYRVVVHLDAEPLRAPLEDGALDEDPDRLVAQSPVGG